MSYEVVRPLGSGTSGEVFEVRDASGQRFALKRFEGLDETQRRRFERELSGLLRLRHPNIVAVHDAGFEPEPQLVMELVEGESLASLVARAGPLSLERTLERFAALAEALAAVHEAGFLHRDVKPDNILIEAETERVVLVDFGLIKAAEGWAESLALTATGAMVGTPAWMAPEQFDAELYGRETPATDVWGWAATLIVALTGEPPFTGATLLTIAQRVTGESPPRLRSRRGDIPAWLDELCAACLNRDPALRPSAREVAASLRARRYGPRRAATGLLLGLTALAALALAWALRGAPARPLTSAPPPGPRVVAAGELELVVKAEAGARVAFERWQGAGWAPIVEVVADPLGQARARVFVPDEGLTVRARAPGATGALRWELRCDHAAPRLTGDLDAPGEGFLRVDALPGTLLLRVEDESPCQLFANGREVEVSAEGAARVDLSEADWAAPLRLEAVDAQGHKSEWRGLILVGREDDPALILQDLELWRASEPAAQDAAIAAVGARLGAAFSHLETATYEVGGSRARIATFRHRSGLELNLLPGGLETIGLPEGRVEAEAAACAAAHAELLARMSSEMEGLKMLRRRESYLGATFDGERPTRELRLRPFLIGRTEAPWGAFTGSLAISEELERAYASSSQPARWPLTEATAVEVAELCRRAGLRLPSEAEWEYACRAGTETRFFWGDIFDPRYCWSLLDAPQTPHPLNLQPAAFDAQRANAFGLCDTLGNAWELVADDWVPHSERPLDGSPFDEQGVARPLRRGGGMLFGGGTHARVTARVRETPETARATTTGFRVACSIP